MTASSPASTARPSGRNADALRTVSLDINVSKHAEGSCPVSYTHLTLPTSRAV